jgi:transcriptional regulator with XRE-family HTH domain
MSSRTYCELLRYRIRKNLSLADLSELCGLSIATLWRLERGVTKPSARTLVKLQDALNLTPDEVQRLTAISDDAAPRRGQAAD